MISVSRDSLCLLGRVWPGRRATVMHNRTYSAPAGQSPEAHQSPEARDGRMATISSIRCQSAESAISLLIDVIFS